MLLWPLHWLLQGVHPVAVWLIIAVALGLVLVLTERQCRSQPADRQHWDAAGPSLG